MTSDYFTERKSCRQYKPESIPDSTLKTIITRAMKAPTCGNMQLYSVIVTKDPNNLKNLSALHFNQPAAATAPVILTVCADFNRFTRWCNLKDADAGFDNYHSFIVAMTDAIIFCQQIATIAEMEGFSTCYLGTVNYNAREISELLQLPDLVVPVASISIGLAAGECEATSRLSADAIMHNEKYRSVSDKEIIEFYKKLEKEENSDKFIKENNKENLAQVIAEVRYPRSMNESVSESFYELIANKGFKYPQ